MEWGARLRNRLRQLRRVKSYGAAVFAGAKTGGRAGDRWSVIGNRRTEMVLIFFIWVGAT